MTSTRDTDETGRDLGREGQETADGTPPGEARPRAARDPMIGREINQLQIVSSLGHGGFGSVYLAEHKELHMPFAVKVLNLFQSTRPEVVERFRREARAIAKLQHPHIIEVTDFGWLEGQGYYLVMEYAGAWSLADAMDQCPPGTGFPIPRAMRIVEQLCDALHWVHQHDIVHRDLKPTNILLDQDAKGREQVKLIDFGIAALSDELSLTQTGVTMGTPAYMSPEQARGTKEVLDGRSDIYSLGVLLFQMMTGKLPFVGKGLAAYVRLHVMKPPPRLQDLAPDRAWHPQLESVLQAALSKAPEDRPADARTFGRACAEALKAQALLEEQTLASPVPSLEDFSRLPMASDPPLADAAAPEAAAAPGSGGLKLSWRVALLGLAFCFLAGGAVAWLLVTRAPSAPTSPHYEIHSQPKATIYVGGEKLGQTPYFGEGAVGQQLVFELRRPGYQNLSLRWTLGSAPIQKRTFRLRPLLPKRR